MFLHARDELLVSLTQAGPLAIESIDFYHLVASFLSMQRPFQTAFLDGVEMGDESSFMFMDGGARNAKFLLFRR